MNNKIKVGDTFPVYEVIYFPPNKALKIDMIGKVGLGLDTILSNNSLKAYAHQLVVSDYNSVWFKTDEIKQVGTLRIKSLKPKTKEFKVGEICFCWYFENRYQSTKVELYWCEIIKLGTEYAECKLFFGEEYDGKNRVRGIFKDVCLADLVKA